MDNSDIKLAAKGTVSDLLKVLQAAVDKGKGHLPVVMYSDEEGNDIHRLQSCSVYADCMLLIPSHDFLD